MFGVEILQQDDFERTLYQRFPDKKNLAGAGIWNHNISALTFLPGHYLPYKDSTQLMT